MKKEIPLYRMIYNKIVNRILVGIYPKGYQLPSIQKMHDTSEVGFTSLRRALKLLQDEGFIYSEPRKSPVVIFDVEKEECRKLRHQIFLSRCHAHLSCYQSIPMLIPGMVTMGALHCTKETLKQLEILGRTPASQLHTKLDQLRLVYSWQSLVVHAAGNALADDLFLQIHGFDDLRFIVMKAEPVLPGEAEISIQTLRFWNQLIREGQFSTLHTMQLLFCRQAFYLLERSFLPLFAEPEYKQVTQLPFRWFVQQLSLPLYKKIAWDMLRQAYLSSLQPGNLFPSEAALMKTYQVSAITIRASVALLNQLGIAQTVNGVGTIYTGTCDTTHEQIGSFLSESQEALEILCSMVSSTAYLVFPSLQEQEIRPLFDSLQQTSTADRILVTLLQTFVQKISNPALDDIYEQLETRLLFGFALKNISLSTEKLHDNLEECFAHLSQGNPEAFAAQLSIFCMNLRDQILPLLS